MNFLEILSTAPSLRGTRLRLEFPETGDRIGQRLKLVTDSGESLSLFESSDVTPVPAENQAVTAEPWPTSPPVQQLLLEERGEDRVALGVGMFGKHHWAVSVLQTANAFQFEIACRVNPQQPPAGAFQSCYQMCGNGASSLAAVHQERQDQEIRIALPNAGTLVVESSHVLHLGDDHFTILAATPASEELQRDKAATITWQYAWSWEV